MEYQNINSDITIEPLEERAEDTIVVKAKKDEKSASQRLRNVIYALWASKKEAGEYIEQDFETYYRLTMEGIINKAKQQLEEYD